MSVELDDLANRAEAAGFPTLAAGYRRDAQLIRELNGPEYFLSSMLVGTKILDSYSAPQPEVTPASEPSIPLSVLGSVLRRVSHDAASDIARYSEYMVLANKQGIRSTGDICFSSILIAAGKTEAVAEITELIKHNDGEQVDPKNI